MAETNKKIEKTREIAEFEWAFTMELKRGFVFNYSLYFFECTANEASHVITRYGEAVRKHEFLRTTYLYNKEHQLKGCVLFPRCFSVINRDLQDMDPEAKEVAMDHISQAEALRIYELGKSFLTYCTAVKIEKNKVRMVLSVCSGLRKFMKEEDLLLEVFGRCGRVELDEADGSDEASRQVAYLHYQKTLMPLPQKIVRERKGTNLVTEHFPLDEQLSSRLIEYENNHPGSLKVACLVTWSAILNRIFRINRLMMGVEQQNRRLSLVPIKVDKFKGMTSLKDSILDQYSEVDKYSGLRLDDIDVAIKDKVLDYVFMSHNFYEMEPMSSALQNMQKNVLYHNKNDANDVPLKVVYQFQGNNPTLVYKYDSDFFKDYNVASMHENFVRLLETVVTKDEHTQVDKPLPVEHREDANRERMLNNNRIALKKCRVFQSVDSGLLEKMVPNVRVMQLMAEQEILSANSQCDCIYIVMSGAVEMASVNKKKELVPILVIKKNQIFGIEALYENSMSRNYYRALKDNTVILQLPVATFSEILSKEPAVITRLLEAQGERLSKLEKLWMMS